MKKRKPRAIVELTNHAKETSAQQRYKLIAKKLVKRLWTRFYNDIEKNMPPNLNHRIATSVTTEIIKQIYKKYGRTNVDNHQLLSQYLACI